MTLPVDKWAGPQSRPLIHRHYYGYDPNPAHIPPTQAS